MAVVDFLRRGKKNLTVAYYDHGTGNTPLAVSLIGSYCRKHGLSFVWENNSRDCPKGVSKEEFWRNCRYEFLMQLSQEKKASVITCHHLGDQVEQYLFSSLHGKVRLIPYRSWKGKVIRPFLLNPKFEFIRWCDEKNVPYLVDPSNLDIQYRRNYIRHKLLPVALKVNPGLNKTVRKLMRKSMEV